MEKFNFKKEIIFWILLIGPLIYIALIWAQLPDIIPVHFDMHGTPNGWGGRWSILLMPGLNIVAYLLILFLPKIDPKRMNSSVSGDLFYKIRFILVLFLSLISIFITYVTIHQNKDSNPIHWIPVGIFLLFSVLGNFMINIKPNWFIGVRTPWTLSSDTVWRDTHQVIGRMWFFGGLISAALCFFVGESWIAYLILILALGSAVFGFAYSFWLYRQEQKSKASQG